MAHCVTIKWLKKKKTAKVVYILVGKMQDLGILNRETPEGTS